MRGDGSGRARALRQAREAGSRLATQLSSLLTGARLSDPMSGFFLMRREVFDEVAPTLSKDGFKILLDIIVSATALPLAARPRSSAISEVPYTFRARHAGESKMNPLVVVQFLGLLVSKLSRGLLPTSFLLFSLVGASGILVHMAALWLARECARLQLHQFAAGRDARRDDDQLRAQQRADLCRQEAARLAASGSAC